MEPTRRECPICNRILAWRDGYYSCEQDGDWFSYSPNLLVRAPCADARMAERVSMPWEQRVTHAF